MPMETLEEVRLLSNLETGQDKLLQIVLFGQPELDATLGRYEIRQLKERITHGFLLTPFQRWEIRDYLMSRLRASGFRGGEVFGPSAVKAIEQYSAGLVRRINIIADKSMLAAYAEQSMTVSPKHVRMAADDSEYQSSRRLPPWAGMAAAAALLLAVAVGVFMIMRDGGTTRTMVPAGNGIATPSATQDAAPAGPAVAAGEQKPAERATTTGAQPATTSTAPPANSR